MTDDVEKIFNQRENAAQLPDANYTRTKAGNLYYVSAGSPVGLRVSEEPSEAPGAEAVQTGLDTSASFDYLMQKAEQDVAQDTDVMTVDRMIATPEIVYDAMQIYEMFEGQPFRGGADDVIDYALNVQSDFMFNIGGIPGVGTDAGGTIAQAAHILSQEDPDKAQAFLDFMGAYEQLPTFTSAGVSRAFRSIFTDPTTYAGIVSAGAGLFARQTTQTGIKLGIKQALQQMARPAQFATQRPVAAGALAGAGYSEVGEVGQMAVETAAGDAPTPLEAGIRATVAPAIGATVGAGLAKGAEVLLPPVGKAIGDFIESSGEAAKERGGTTLSSGVNPDPLIAAAGDAVAKFRAPTEKQPGVIAFHGSGADFDEFKLEKIGTGEGAQAYGYGLYFAEKEDIASYYKNMMQRSVDIDGEPYIRGNNINDDLVDPDIADDLGATNGDLEAAIKDSEEFLQEMIAADNVNAIRSTSRELEKLKELRGRITSNDQEGKMYKVGLEPKPEDMLDYQIPIEQQPENIQQTVKKALSYIYPDVKDPALSMRGSDLQNAIINRIAVSRGNIEKMSDPIDADIARIDPNNEKTEAAIAAQIMLEQGIPGMKYRDAGSRGGAKSLKDASFNYVIFDDKMIKILEKYGIVGPVAITGVAASQQEGESANVDT